MKIGIEAQRLLRTKKHGMDMVALELIRHLQRIDTVNEYVVFVRPDADYACLPTAPNFEIVTLEGLPGFAAWEQWTLPRAAARAGCDLLHCTGNTGPVFSSVPLITTLHDIIFMEQINLFQKKASWYQRLGNVYRRFVVPTVVRKSKRVVTVSHFEKERIARFFNIGPEHLRVVYNGVGEHFKQLSDQNALQQFAAKYKLPTPFFLFLGNTAPKKNTPGVLQAFARFNDWYPDQYYLVMLDYEEKKLQQLVHSLGIPEIRKRIFLTGYVSNFELPALINQCVGFLYPSLRESFGIPILEGMACGVPVITSNTSSMPEVAGRQAALLVDPNQPEALARAMRQLVENPDETRQMAARGLERAREFSWENTARQMLALYEEVYQEYLAKTPLKWKEEIL